MNKKVFPKFLMLALVVGVLTLTSTMTVFGDTASTTTTVDNVAPAFTTDTADGWTQGYTGTATTDVRASSSTTFPTNQGTDVDFTATASDTNNDNYYLIVCESAGVTGNASAAPSCTGTLICVSSSTASASEASCVEDTTGNANETVNWYSYVCDHNGSSSCSAVSASSQGGINDEVGSGGTPTASGSPFHVNHRSTYTAGIAAVDPGDTVTVTNSADADSDTNGSQDTVTLYVCSGQSDQGGVTTAFDFRANTCTGGTLLCSQSGVNPSSADATCDDTTDIVSVPTAHATDYTTLTFMEDSHSFDSTSTSGYDFTVNDVAPVITSYTTTDSVDGTISAGGSDDLTRLVTFTDDNGDNDPTLVDMAIFDADDSETDACTADEQNCYRFDNEDLTGAANCAISNRSTAGSGKTALGTDNSLSLSCDFTVFFNANTSSNWEVSATVTDGTGDTNFADSNVNTVVAALLGMGVSETTIAYGTVGLGGTSTSGDTTTVQNLGNQIADYQVSGTDMSSGGDTIAAAQQKWDHTTLDFDWDSSGTAYAMVNTPTGTVESGGCVNDALAVRAVAATGTEDETVFWKIRIPAAQESGSYSGTNTFTAASDGTCTGSSV